MQALRLCWVTEAMRPQQDDQHILFRVLLSFDISDIASSHCCLSTCKSTRQRLEPCLHPSSTPLAGSHHKLQGLEHPPHPTEAEVSALSPKRWTPSNTRKLWKNWGQKGDSRSIPLDAFPHFKANPGFQWIFSSEKPGTYWNLATYFDLLDQMKQIAISTAVPQGAWYIHALPLQRIQRTSLSFPLTQTWLLLL